MPHVVNKYTEMMKEGEQKIKELKAILRTPRLYDQYRKRIERKVNDEIARKYTIYGENDSIMNT